jgi:hypothetical protein
LKNKSNKNKMCECNLDTRQYRDLQRQLKIYAVCGYTLNVPLNKSKAILQAELERLKGEAPPAREYKPRGARKQKPKKSTIPLILSPAPKPAPKPAEKPAEKRQTSKMEGPQKVEHFGAIKKAGGARPKESEEFKPPPTVFGSLRKK